MPKPLPHTLICTVGTSLLTGLGRLPQGSHTDLHDACQCRDARATARALASLGPEELHLCGAEIASTLSLSDAQLVQDRPNLHLCLSQTDDGRCAGQVIDYYFQALNGWGVTAHLHVIEHLQDADPNAFATSGLRNLARQIAAIVRQAGGGQFCAINATGGYKAQLGIAILVGQALDTPVFYQHERFPRIIALPPMPIDWNWDLLARHADLLQALENGDRDLGPGQVPEPLRIFIDELPAEDGRTLCALSPLGQTYLDAFRQRHPLPRALPPAAPADLRSPPKLPPHHYPVGFEEFLAKLWQEAPYVTTCHTVSYAGQRGIGSRCFREEPQADGTCRIVGEFRDSTGFGARAAILTTAATPAQRTAAVVDLNGRYGED